MVDFTEHGYLPLLSLKPAEMNAVEELPEHSKDELLPLFFLRRWVGAHNLISSLGRIEEAFGNRNMLLEVGVEEVGTGQRRQVHDELDVLRAPDNGFLAWREFVAARENIVPVIQLSDVSQLQQQIAFFSDLGRGLAIRVPEPAFGFISNFSQSIADIIGSGSNLCFIIDFGRQDRHLLNRQAECVQFVHRIRDHLENCTISISATSFPDSFAGLPSQDIFERLLFDGVSIATGDTRLLYSDRGSARAESTGGGGAEIPPRVDYALQAGWTFFRADGAEDRQLNYQLQAQAAMASDGWDENLHVWGTQLIERTAEGEPNAIHSPKTSTEARINIHLHRQLYYGGEGLYATDGDWIE